MAHEDEHDDSMPGQDSFIDVICNMVGILIILVMIAGAHAGSNPLEYFSPDEEAKPTAMTEDPKEIKELRAELTAAQKAALSLANKVNTSMSQSGNLRRQALQVEAERQSLETIRAEIEAEIQIRRAKLDAPSKKHFDVKCRVDAAMLKLHELTQAQLALTETTEVEERECVPTPMSKSVDEEAIHVRLKHRQLKMVPATALYRLACESGMRSSSRTKGNKQVADQTFGPIDGFKLKVAVEGRNMPSMSGLPDMLDTSTIVDTFTFFPLSDDIGIPVEQALLPDSEFMKAVKSSRSPVVVWLYPDSYADVGALKRALWEAGTSVALFPLGSSRDPIRFSTHGRKAYAQ